ncbi:MAG: hypothetical protein CMI54_05720 [Parcubacteria group bacterium]|nr:hypothetical protein [Parcubacteria group bacterium]|tara:strand:+ start:1922 stop:2119 length:198 start_codon:yes stop_codon:yes gene_type:complete
MRLEIIRELKSKGSKVELLLEVDSEFLEIYRSETGDYDDPINQEWFNEWFEGLVKYGIEGDDWLK